MGYADRTKRPPRMRGQRGKGIDAAPIWIPIWPKDREALIGQAAFLLTLAEFGPSLLGRRGKK